MLPPWAKMACCAAEDFGVPSAQVPDTYVSYVLNAQMQEPVFVNANKGI
jgi:hypothetical protein